MAVATVKAHDTNLLGGFEVVRLTTTTTSDTYQSRKFATIVTAIGNNESDNDGVSVAVSGTTVTIGVATAGDVVTLLLAGRK